MKIHFAFFSIGYLGYYISLLGVSYVTKNKKSVICFQTFSLIMRMTSVHLGLYKVEPGMIWH